MHQFLIVNIQIPPLIIYIIITTFWNYDPRITFCNLSITLSSKFCPGEHPDRAAKHNHWCPVEQRQPGRIYWNFLCWTTMTYEIYSPICLRLSQPALSQVGTIGKSPSRNAETLKRQKRLVRQVNIFLYVMIMQLWLPTIMKTLKICRKLDMKMWCWPYGTRQLSLCVFWETALSCPRQTRWVSAGQYKDHQIRRKKTKGEELFYRTFFYVVSKFSD